MTHTAEIQIRSLDGWEEWLVFEKRDGYISIGVDTKGPDRERVRDPEMGVSVDDENLARFIEVLQAMQSEGDERP